MTALRDNPSAIAESASGAPVMVSGWHPVDKVTIGDGKTGLIYDHAVTGTVASVVTPDFVDGYEYRVVAHNLEHNAPGDTRLSLDGYFETDAAYRRLFYSPLSSENAFYGLDCTILMPRIPKRTHIVNGVAYIDSAISGVADTTAYDATLQKLLRARIYFSSGNITGGKIWFFRRREYASSP
jgi:hypothetical protein